MEETSNLIDTENTLLGKENHQNEASPSNEENQVEDEASLDNTITPTRYEITSYGADYDVEGLVKRINRGDIVIPPFQRNYVWNKSEASRFIESLLLGLPIPAIFFAREPEENKLLVIDGQQRLKTLQFFYNGFFNPKEEDKKKEDKKKEIFQLINVQPELEGLTFKTLNDKDRVRLNDSLIHAIIIKQESPQDGGTSMYHIFDRLNSEGRSLNPQEIRAAVYHGEFIEFIKKLNAYGNWRKIYGKENTRLKDQELIIRFLALYFESDKYERPMNEFLNKFSEKSRKANNKFLEEAGEIFKGTIDLVLQSVGRKAFRPVRAINAAVFDSVMVGLARRLAQGYVNNSERVASAYKELITDKEYLRLIAQSTSDEANVESRLKKATDKFRGI